MRILEPIPLPVDGQLITGQAPNVEPGHPGDNQVRIRNVEVPTITPMIPEDPCGSAVVIAPGGGFHKLSVESEGEWVAERLAERGMTSFVLHYRLEPTPRGPEGDGWDYSNTMSATNPSYLDEVGGRWRGRVGDDGGTAAAVIRERAAEWGLDPARLGMMGFSAGGFVTFATAIDRPETDLAFLAGIYPVAWEGLAAPADPAPLFLAWASNDEHREAVIDASLSAYRSWWQAGGVAEAHAYASGGHGFGAHPQGAESDRWMDDFIAWLDARGHFARA